MRFGGGGGELKPLHQIVFNYILLLDDIRQLKSLMGQM